MAEGFFSVEPSIDAVPGDTLHTFEWSVPNFKQALENIKHKQGSKIVSPFFVGKYNGIGIPYCSWQIEVFLMERPWSRGPLICCDLELREELNEHPKFEYRYELTLLDTNLQVYATKRSKSNCPPTAWDFEDSVGQYKCLPPVFRVRCKLWIKDKELAVPVPKVQDLLQLHNDFRQLLNSPEFSDVTIVTEDSTLKAHKVILSCRSPVFSAMFQTNMSETLTNTVKIEEFSGRTVKGMMEFIYYGGKEAIKEDYIELLKIADKYQLEPLKMACVNEAMLKMSTENVIEMLIIGDMYAVPNLKWKAMHFINSNEGNSIFFSVYQNGEKFKKFADEHPQLLQELYQNLRKKCVIGQFFREFKENIETGEITIFTKEEGMTANTNGRTAVERPSGPYSYFDTTAARQYLWNGRI